MRFSSVRPSRTRRFVMIAACCALGAAVARFLGGGAEAHDAAAPGERELEGGLATSAPGASPPHEAQAAGTLPLAPAALPALHAAPHTPSPATGLAPHGRAAAAGSSAFEPPQFIELPSVAPEGGEAPLGVAAVARWSEEASDPAWSQAMTNHLEDALRDLEIDGELLETSCRSTLCRVQMRFESLDHATSFAEAAGKPTQREYARVRMGSEASLTLDVFVSRAP